MVRKLKRLWNLVLKAVLRNTGIDVPKIHDVSRILERYNTCYQKRSERT